MEASYREALSGVCRHHRTLLPTARANQLLLLLFRLQGLGLLCSGYRLLDMPLVSAFVTESVFLLQAQRIFAEPDR